MTTQLTLVNLPRRRRTNTGAASTAAASTAATSPAAASVTAAEPNRPSRSSTTPPWLLDERTRTVGLVGVARAREVLAEVRRTADADGARASDEPAAA